MPRKPSMGEGASESSLPPPRDPPFPANARKAPEPGDKAGRYRHASQIEACLLRDIAEQAECRGATIVVTVRRDESATPPWVVDVRLSGKHSEACYDRVRALINEARRRYALY